MARLTTLASISALALFASPALLASACSSGDDTQAAAGDGGTTQGEDGGALPVQDGGGQQQGDGAACSNPVAQDPLAAKRLACSFAKGARVLDTLGLNDAQRAAIPLKHIIVVTEENRSFDHYFGQLPAAGYKDVNGWPAGFTNKDLTNKVVGLSHATSTCLAGDPPHQGAGMMAQWDNGKMDGFVKNAAVKGSDGHYVMGYYDQTDLPFYYWVAQTFAMSDTYHASALAGTWANRDYLYAATSDGVTDTGSTQINVPTIYDALDKAKVSWGVYSDGGPRQDSIGWTKTHVGFENFQAFLDAAKNGTLPAVSFVDPGTGQDEHPPANVHDGETWEHKIYDAVTSSPSWKDTALILTYDEAGGLPDHVAPPSACLASPDQTAFDHYGIRVPMMLVSPYARPHYVSHVLHDHTSVLRLIEAVFDLPALTGRDANADALLDMFDFVCPAQVAPPAAPAAGTGACK